MEFEGSWKGGLCVWVARGWGRGGESTRVFLLDYAITITARATSVFSNRHIDVNRYFFSLLSLFSSSFFLIL